MRFLTNAEYHTRILLDISTNYLIYFLIFIKFVLQGGNLGYLKQIRAEENFRVQQRERKSLPQTISYSLALDRSKCAPNAPFNNGSSASTIIHTIDRVSVPTAVKLSALRIPNQFQKKKMAANMNP